MSSHREAPEISKDPVADSTDLYAFVSPDKADTVTIIANYVPLESPDGGPNFYEFGTDVLYAINIDNDGDGKADISYLFEFQSETTNLDTFLYNTGPIGSLTDPNWNRRQTYTVTKILSSGKMTVLGAGLPCPPCNVGPLSTPNYETALANPAIQTLSDGSSVFAGQRAEGFYVDLGSIFDLAVLRPIAADHILANLLPTMSGINATKELNVHSIAIQVPMTELTRHHRMPTNPAAPQSVIGVWTTASRQAATVLPSSPMASGMPTYAGPWVQVDPGRTGIKVNCDSPGCWRSDVRGARTRPVGREVSERRTGDAERECQGRANGDDLLRPADSPKSLHVLLLSSQWGTRRGRRVRRSLPTSQATKHGLWIITSPLPKNPIGSCLLPNGSL